jgi:hypothetical protein
MEPDNCSVYIKRDSIFITPSIPKHLLPLTFTPTLPIRFIKKIKVMKKIKSNIIIIFDFL